jgi:putative endonuclease
MEEKCYYVYMLTNLRRNVLYTGVTNDLMRRVYEHKHKLIEGFTTRYNVNNLVHYEMYSEVTDAISREKQIKSWTRKQKNALVESHNKRWDDLAEELFGF